METKKKGCVYLLGHVPSKAILKIGFSTRLRKRYIQLASIDGGGLCRNSTLEMLMLVPNQRWADEFRVHKLFSGLRIERTEWFRDDGTIRAWFTEFGIKYRRCDCGSYLDESGTCADEYLAHDAYLRSQIIESGIPENVDEFIQHIQQSTGSEILAESLKHPGVPESFKRWIRKRFNVT